MKKVSLVVFIATMAIATSVFAQDAAKSTPQEKAKTTEIKAAEVKKEEPKTDMKKSGKPSKKHHKMVKKAEKK